MRYFFGLISALLMVALLAQFCAAASPPAVKSESYVVMDVKTGQVLAQKEAHKQMFPASITKILTCALALQNGSPQDIHTMSYEATHSIGYGTTHIALTENERVTVADLLNATMIESANDAANGLAEYVAGGLGEFSDMMNQKAAELGATNTHFTNAHGLHDKAHYTTAYDMALITRWALTVDGFRTLFGAEKYTIPPTNKQPQKRNIGTHHHMLVQSKYYYEGTAGGKLGWTPEARHTLVTLAKRGDMELICVVMKTTAQYDKYVDAAALLDYCFENFSTATMQVAHYANKPIPVYDGDKQTGEVVIPVQDVDIIRPPTVAKIDITTELVAPEQYSVADTIAPQVRFLDPQGNLLAEMPLQWVMNSLEETLAATLVVKDERLPPSEKLLITQLFWGVLGIIGLAISILLLIRWRNLKVLERKRMVRARKLQEQQRLRELMAIGAKPVSHQDSMRSLGQRRSR